VRGRETDSRNAARRPGPDPTDPGIGPDRTQPMLPIEFDETEKRTHDYVRHGTTNLLAALNVGTGELFGECNLPVTVMTSWLPQESC
jgi:hypothetical protein